MDSILYLSHESPVTVGGWLPNEVKKLWPPWSSSLYEHRF